MCEALPVYAWGRSCTVSIQNHHSWDDYGGEDWCHLGEKAIWSVYIEGSAKLEGGNWDWSGNPRATTLSMRHSLHVHNSSPYLCVLFYVMERRLAVWLSVIYCHGLQGMYGIYCTEVRGPRSINAMYPECMWYNNFISRRLTNKF